MALKASYTTEEITHGLLPPTCDDVSITFDGRRLDTAEKVIAFCAEIQAEFDAEDAAEAANLASETSNG